MFITVLSYLPQMLFTLAAGAALVGLLIWVMAAQDAADKRYAYGAWVLAGLFAVAGMARLVA
ncbi:MAG: hypothetical protein SFU83_08275 [Meiothermus sp.]|nr:hypothetical protein [Meiothermus sp.]